MEISVGARSSSLSRAQVAEVEKALQSFYPNVRFHVHYIDTLGDKDKKSSLRSLGKSDFFTREIDLLQKEGLVRLAIHSAKDLPDPLPEYLSIAAITEGVDPSDSIVLRKGSSWEQLPKEATIATSSWSREMRVRELREDLTIVDIRGNIEERLSKLERGEIEGVVVAEAALIRLQLTHLNRIRLPGPTAPGQGKLACVIGKEDSELRRLLSVLKSSCI